MYWACWCTLRPRVLPCWLCWQIDKCSTASGPAALSAQSELVSRDLAAQQQLEPTLIENRHIQFSGARQLGACLRTGHQVTRAFRYCRADLGAAILQSRTGLLPRHGLKGTGKYDRDPGERTRGAR